MNGNSSDDGSNDEDQNILFKYIEAKRKEPTYCESGPWNQIFLDFKLYIVKFECIGCFQILCEIRTEICNHTKCRKCKPVCIEVCRQTLVDTLLFKRQEVVDKLKANYEHLGFNVTFINKVEEPKKKRKHPGDD